jgi:hypothetical protein
MLNLSRPSRMHLRRLSLMALALGSLTWPAAKASGTASWKSALPPPRPRPLPRKARRGGRGRRRFVSPVTVGTVSDDSDSQEANPDDQPPVEGDFDQQQQSDNQPSPISNPTRAAATGEPAAAGRPARPGQPAARRRKLIGCLAAKAPLLHHGTALSPAHVPGWRCTRS